MLSPADRVVEVYPGLLYGIWNALQQLEVSHGS